MKQLSILLFAFALLGNCACAQLSDNFSDGDFTNNPAWSTAAGDFIVNPAFQLQSNNQVANAAFYISTPSTRATVAEWLINITLAFNTSSTNYADVFLTASAADLTAAATSGYFVRLGGTNDEICLYRRDAGGTITKIIDGADGILNSSNNTINLRVTRNAANVFMLQRDVTGTSANYVTEGTVTDATFTTSAFFGIYIKQSTASFFQRHFFDDIIVRAFVPDTTPPAIVSATAISNNSVDVLFSESVDAATAQQPGNYNVNNSIGFPLSAVRDAVNTALVHLSFANSFPPRTNLQLTVNGVQDLAGNLLNNGIASFSFFTAFAYDVLIDELMADPSPQVGLPNAEWIELKNTSGFTINLQGWRVADASSQSGPMPAYQLRADSFVIVCASGALASLSAFGPAIAVTSFPSLDNSGDVLSLTSNTGKTIHSLAYTDAWYKNELKKDGGWTLEIVDTKNPCGGIENWNASTDARGGTPASTNAVNGTVTDVAGPKLVRAVANDATHITLTFNENLDSTTAVNLAGYSISDGIGSPVVATAIAPQFIQVQLTLASALQFGKVYTVSATAATDCKGNAMSTARSTQVGLFANLLKFDVIVNEILFNPKPDANDYVELYNRSNKIINLKNSYLANRSSAGIIAGITQISSTDYPLFPGDFIVATKDPESIRRNYVAYNPDAFITVNTPSYNDDAGNVLLLNEQGNIIDEISYSDKWHFALISNTEGVALERINYNDTTLVPAEQQKNWHSAASSAGYGTPTYKNSQAAEATAVQGDITVSPKIFSPDNDGQDDVATITYRFPEQGYVANITIFDAAGRPVRYLQRNALSGITGYYRWDGLGENQKKLPVGLYVVYTEVFNLTGKTRRFKNTITLARKN